MEDRDVIAPAQNICRALTLALMSASPVEAAKKNKHKKTTDSFTIARTETQYRGTNLVPAGPLYFSGTYLGDDPDPNIRFQLLRDISGRFGGEQ